MMNEGRINVYVPPISNFPELLLGGYVFKDRIQIPSTADGQRNKVMSMASAPATASMAAEQRLEERELHQLYITDSQGRLLEHMCYSGNDYRAALRESFAADTMDFSKVGLNLHSNPNMKKEPSCSSAIQSQE